MLPIQPLRFDHGNEELAAVGVGPRIGHRNHPHVMLHVKVLVLELIAVDGLAPGAVVVGEVPSLDHEVINYPVEG